MAIPSSSTKFIKGASDLFRRSKFALNPEDGVIVSPAASPILRFSDITSGPSSGLGDGLGSGAIVTIWGQGLGNSQGSNKVYFTDSGGIKREAAHIYYWKMANGTAPGGPADLWSSHYMQEIAFSLPSSLAGNGTITVEVGGVESNALAFTVRTGRILWCASGTDGGNNANTGTYSSPKEYVNGNIASSSGNSFGNGNLIAGDIVYSRSVQEPAFAGGGTECGLYLRSCSGTETNPIALVAYPGAFTNVSAAQKGLQPYLSSGIHISKYRLAVGEKLDSDTSIGTLGSTKYNSHIGLSNWSRVVGNYLVENPGTAFDGQLGSIVANGDGANKFAILGNHLFDIGNDYTSHYAHTMYISIRDSATTAEAGEVSFNHLKDCKAKYGLHFYDQAYSGEACGTYTGTLKIRNNVVVNQKGPGIHATTYQTDGNACWAIDIEIVGNLLINCGLGPVAETANGTAPQAIDIGGQINTATVVIDSNTIYRWSDAGSRAYGTPKGVQLGFSYNDPNVTLTNNVLVTAFDSAYIATSGLTTINTINKNAYWNTSGSATNAIIPTADTAAIVSDPLITISGSLADVGAGSPLIDSAVNKQQAINIYGVASNNVGCI